MDARLSAWRWRARRTASRGYVLRPLLAHLFGSSLALIKGVRIKGLRKLKSAMPAGSIFMTAGDNSHSAGCDRKPTFWPNKEKNGRPSKSQLRDSWLAGNKNINARLFRILFLVKQATSQLMEVQTFLTSISSNNTYERMRGRKGD